MKTGKFEKMPDVNFVELKMLKKFILTFLEALHLNFGVFVQSFMAEIYQKHNSVSSKRLFFRLSIIQNLIHF